MISNAISESNEVMANSGTGVTLNLMHSYETDGETYSMDDLGKMRDPSDGFMDEMHDLWKQYHADLVLLFDYISYTGGVAYVLPYEDGAPRSGFGITRIQQVASTYTVVHEMGHNMGCSHHKLQESHGLYPYSHGWRGRKEGILWDTKYATVMTYSNLNDGEGSFSEIPYFSSSGIGYKEFNSIGDANDADNARTIRQTKHVIALYSDAINIALSGLSVNNGALTLSPAFNPGTENYSVNVPNSVSSVTITGTASHSCASVDGNGVKNLNVRNNTFTVTAILMGESKSYTVTVNRAVSGDAALKSLTIDPPGAVPLPFDPFVTRMEISVDSSVTKVTITGEASHADAKVEGDGEKSLKPGSNTFIITCKAPDGTIKEYIR
jgi:hypothetical protein